MQLIYIATLLCVSATSPSDVFRRLQADIETTSEFFASAARKGVPDFPMPYGEQALLVDLLSVSPGAESVLHRLAGQPRQVLSEMFAATALGIVRKHKSVLRQRDDRAHETERSLEEAIRHTRDEASLTMYRSKLVGVARDRGEIASTLTKVARVEAEIRDFDFEDILTL